MQTTPRHIPTLFRPVSLDSLSLIVFLLVVPIISGFVSVALGRDINWDLRNYHYYNPYAFLTGRMGFDVAPAQLQSYFNPLSDVPFFLMTRHLNSQTIGFAFGLAHGFNLSLVFLLLRKLIPSDLRLHHVLGAVVLLGATAYAPGFLSELGNTMNDNLMGLFVLASLVLILYSQKAAGPASMGVQAGRLCAAGVIFGFAVGLKPTVAPFALGVAAALPTLSPSWRGRALSVLTFAATGLLGALVSGGWWWAELWIRFGNPFFPFFNDLFHSPFARAMSYVDQRYLADEAWQYLIWPVLFSGDNMRIPDLRFGILYATAVIWLISIIRRALHRGRPVDLSSHTHTRFHQATAAFILVFFASGFFLWMLQSSNYRYLIPLELLLPLCFILILDRLHLGTRWYIRLALGAAVLTMISFRPSIWTRLWTRQPWTDRYFQTEIQGVEVSDNALVVILGWAPIAYVIPDLPATFRFVRPEGNLLTAPASPLGVKIREIIETHSGPIYVLYDPLDAKVATAQSEKDLGVSIRTDSCGTVTTNTPDHLMFCPAERVNSMGLLR